MDEERGPIQGIQCGAEIGRPDEVEVRHHHGGSVRRCGESGLGLRLQILVRRRGVENFCHEAPCPGLPIHLQALDSLGDERPQHFWLDDEGVIDKYDGSNAFGPNRMGADENLLNTERQAHDDGGFAAQVIQQFADVPPAPGCMVPLRGLVGTTLPARVERHHPMGRAEVPQLLLPDPGRHGPAGHEHGRRPGSGIQIAERDSVTRHEAAALELIHIFFLLQTFLQVDDEWRFFHRQLANVPRQVKRG